MSSDTIQARKFFDLARKYESQSLPDSAFLLAEKAQSLILKQLGEMNKINADLMHLMARLKNSTGEYDISLGYNLRALKIRLDLFGENNNDVAKSYNNIGIIYNATGEYDKALEYHTKALKIRKAVLGDNHSDVADSYRNIGKTYSSKGDIDSTIENYSKALAVMKVLYGENSRQAALYFYEIANSLWDKGDYENAQIYLTKVLEINKAVLGDNHPEVVKSYNNIGILLDEKGDFDKALEYYQAALELGYKIYGEKHISIAMSYNNIGIVYDEKGDYDKALEYYFKALKLRLDIDGVSQDVAGSYSNIAVIYEEKGDYEKSLEYHLKALKIKKELLGENSIDVASSYTGIGAVYVDKREYDKALEYFLKALQIRKEIPEHKQSDIVQALNNIGAAYWYKGDLSKALEYFSNVLQIRKETLGEKNTYTASAYNNVAAVYVDLKDYDKALEFYRRSLDIKKDILPEIHPDFGMGYDNIGEVYKMKKDYDRSLEYLFKSLRIEKEIYGDKHPIVATNYNLIGSVYAEKGELKTALRYFQKGIASCLTDKFDTADVSKVPVIRRYLDWNSLLASLEGKASIFIREENTANALRHFQACDTLIDLSRRQISTQSDKLALGVKASQIYKEAIDLLVPVNMKKLSGKNAAFAFYFSERNKASVLLEALAGQEAQKFAGIPDSLLNKEHVLKSDIDLFTKRLAEASKTDSAQVALWQGALFEKNRANESLIKYLENSYPAYHSLKYNTKTPVIKDIQKLLDAETAIISYFADDSSITSFTITKNKLFVQKVPSITNLSDSILWFRYGLTKTSQRMQKMYRRLGYKLYMQVMPENILTNSQIKNLVIIPDGELAIIPFETLLTESYKGDINDYKGYPYLIKKYNISYSYSASLYNLTFSPKTFSPVEITKMNDWIAFAPVFDNPGDQKSIMNSMALERQLRSLKTDSILINRSIFDREYIAPLPATEMEAESIFNLFNEHDLKAKVLLFQNANEQFLKSGELSKYKMLHFATHGFINSEKPELSGLLLAQDTTGGEDGILFSGEIYNLNLNADLVTLSACETGLGKIQKGEGIISLTRALLFAGAKNIIVSLWEVADESTSDLMVDFYKNSLSQTMVNSYSESLRNAKLKMISGNKYSHPLYWSPFILIGK